MKLPVTTETIDKLFLELSQFTNALTAKESDLRAQLDTERELRTLGDTYARRVASWIVGTDDGWPLASPFLEIRECIEGTRRQLDKQIAAHCSFKTLSENQAKTIGVLRQALSELVGAETKEELEAMEAAIRVTPGVTVDKVAAINAINALLSVANHPKT